MSTYSIIISDPFGIRLGDASSFIQLEYTRVVNDVGSLTLVLPSSFDTSLLRLPDGRIEVWRRLDTGREYLDTETVWLMKKVTTKLDGSGRTTITLEADTPNCILRDRFHNYGTGDTATILASAPADNLIKALATYNIGANAATGGSYTTFNSNAARNISAYVSIESNSSQGYTMAYEGSWRELLKCMQEIAASSTQNSIYLAFDIVAPSPGTLELRTYTQQRGVDHRFPGGQNPVILSPEMGNLGECDLSIDYRGEVTYAQANDPKATAAAQVGSATDTARVGASPFGIREKYVNSGNQATQAVLNSIAAAEVRGGRPRTIFRGRILDTHDTQYGVHWGWGDYVTAQAFGQSFDCRIDAVHVTVEDNNEVVEAWLRSDG